MSTTGNWLHFRFPTLSQLSVPTVRELDQSELWNITDRGTWTNTHLYHTNPVQESREIGHVGPSLKLMGWSSGSPMVRFGVTQMPPVQAWPEKALWKGPLKSIRQLRDAILLFLAKCQTYYSEPRHTQNS
jgi:hypothetical protein